MYLLSGALARLVPLFFGAALALVGARMLHDRLRPRGTGVARASFALVLAGAALLAFPFARRSTMLLAAERAFARGEWDAASVRFSRSVRPGGRLDGTPGVHWGVALMNQKRWGDAERVLLGTIRRPGHGPVRARPDTVQALGVCRYYEGRLDLAARTLSAARLPGLDSLTDYFLGRIADRAGDAGAAERLYLACLRSQPGFHPARHQLTRLLMLAGRREEALRLVSEADALPALRSSVERREVPPASEFFVVQKY